MKSALALLVLGITLLASATPAPEVSANPTPLQPASVIKSKSPNINGNWRGMLGLSDGVNLKVTLNGNVGTYETNYQGQYKKTGSLTVSQNGNQVTLTLQNYGSGVVVLNGVVEQNRINGQFHNSQQSGPFGIKKV